MIAQIYLNQQEYFIILAVLLIVVLIPVLFYRLFFKRKYQRTFERSDGFNRKKYLISIFLIGLFMVLGIASAPRIGAGDIGMALYLTGNLLAIHFAMKRLSHIGVSKKWGWLGLFSMTPLFVIGMWLHWFCLFVPSMTKKEG